MAGEYPTTIKTFDTLVNGVDRVLSEHQNERGDEITAIETWLFRALALAAHVDSHTLSGNLTLVDGDKAIQKVDCNGANRDATLPANAATNHIFYIANVSAGAYKITVKNSGGSTIATIFQGQALAILPSGSGWYKLGNGTTTPTAGDMPIALANGYIDSWVSGIPEGMRNGIIVVTNPSSDLVISIKTLAGTDPSATDPVKVRINSVERTITAALSVTIPDGTNTFDAGSAVLATKEIDLFVYLSWRAASSTVVLGTSRIPWGTVYSDFSGTATNQKYAAFSTTPASTDDCVVVGRIAATLSAGAGYTWTSTSQSAPTSTNTIQRPIYETRWLILAAPNFTVSTIDNGAGGQPPINEFRYRFSGRKVDAHISGNGVKAGAGNYFTFASADLPMAPSNLTGANAIGVAYNSDNVLPGVAVYFSINLHCVFSASIADNQAFTNGWGANFGYEA